MFFFLIFYFETPYSPVEPVDPSKPDKLRVKFTFDANLECWASVFLVASENPKEGCRVTPFGAGRAAPRRTKHPQGLGQMYESKPEAALDLSGFTVDELTLSRANDFPVIIRLECIAGEPGEGEAARTLPEPAGASLLNWTQTQTTYATLLRQEDGSYGIQVVKQKIWVEGVSYELQEIFGIENCSAGMPLDDDISGKECVVCLSDARDTTVLPCRHMCMCSSCARLLRHQPNNKCPICRTPVESLLEIKVAKSAEPQLTQPPPPPSHRAAATATPPRVGNVDRGSSAGGSAAAQSAEPQPMQPPPPSKRAAATTPQHDGSVDHGSSAGSSVAGKSAEPEPTQPRVESVDRGSTEERVRAALMARRLSET